MIEKKQICISLLLPLLLAACDNVDPEARRQAMHLPPPGFKGDSTQGEALFQKNCISCHGNNGQGSEQGPPLVHPVYNPKHHSDLSFHLAIRDGVQPHHWKFGEMAPLPNVTPEEVEHIIAYVRQEQRRAGIQ
jgi:mono/diheme cytochrome c family protein